MIQLFYCHDKSTGFSTERGRSNDFRGYGEHTRIGRCAMSRECDVIRAEPCEPAGITECDAIDRLSDNGKDTGN